MRQNFSKVLSVLLSLVMLVSACGITAFGNDGEAAAVYYAQFGGTGDGRSESTPGALSAVINSINADGHSLGDTVTVMLMKYDEEPTDGKWDSSADSVWLQYNGIANHTATVVYQSYDPENKSSIAFENVWAESGAGNHMILMGPSVFDGVRIIDNRSDNYTREIMAQNYDLTIKNCELVKIRKADNYAFSDWNGAIMGGANRTGVGTLGNGGNVVVENTRGAYNIAVSGYGDSASQACMTISGDMGVKLGSSSFGNVTVDGAKAGVTTAFGGNVNIVLNGTTLKNIATNNTPNISGMYQLIKNGNVTIENDSVSDSVAADKKYILTVASGTALDVTDVAGTYSVEGNMAYAVSADGLTAWYGADTLTIEAPGTYSVGAASDMDSLKAALPVPEAPEGKIFAGWQDMGTKLIAAFREKTDEGSGEYYVQFGANGDGSSPETPAGALVNVINDINTKYGAGDNVVIYVMTSEGEPTDNKWDSEEDSVWLQYNGIASHTAKITYTSYDVADIASIAFENVWADVTYGNHLGIKGPTVFENIRIIDNRSDGSTRDIYAQGYDLEFRNVSIVKVPKSKGYEFTAWRGHLFAGGYGSTWGNPGGTLTVDDPSYIYDINAGGWSTKADNSPTEDVTINVSGDSAVPELKLDSIQASSGAFCTTFGKNVNIVLNGVTVNNYKTNNTPVINGAYQIIYNNGASIASDNVSGVVTADKYIITSGEGGTLNVTENAGIYSVSSDLKYAYAYDREGNGNTIYYGEDALSVGQPGNYTVKYVSSLYEITEKAPAESGYMFDEWIDNGDGTMTARFVETGAREKDYYVKYGGTGNGKSPETPAATVADVVNTINNIDGLTKGDVANVYIMQSDDWDYGKGTLMVGNNGSNNAPEHHITTWGPGSAYFGYQATLNVTSYDPENPSYLAATPKLGDNNRMVIGGPTNFSNIYIVDMRYGYRELATNGYDVIFGEGTIFAHANCDEYGSYKAWDGVINSAGTSNICVGNAYTANNGAGGTVVFENAFTNRGGSRGIHISSPTTISNTFTEDVTIVLDNPAIDTNIYWGVAKEGVAVNFGKNLNFIVKQARVIDNRTFSSYGPINVSGGFQLITNLKTAWKLNNTDTAIANIPSNVAAAGGKWIIKVDSNDVFISVTETAGTYTVAEGLVAVASDEATGASVVSKNGILTLPAGTYTVTSVPESEITDVEVTVTFDGETDGNTYLKGYSMLLPSRSDTLFEEFVGWTYGGQNYNAGDLFMIPEDAVSIDFVSVWNAFEDTAVVYLDAENGIDTNDGATPETAVGTISKAVELVSAKSESIKKVAIIGTLQHNGYMPQHDCEIIYTGDGSGNSVFDLNNDYIHLNGPTKFENIKIVSTTTANGKFLDTDGNPLVMGEGITTEAPKNIPLRIGVSGYSTVGDKEAPVDVEIYSGQYNTIDVGAYYIEAGNEANNKTPGGTITVNGGIITSINFMSDGWLDSHIGSTWTDDVKVVVNGGSVGNITVNTGARGATFEKTVQILVNNGISTVLPTSITAGGGAWIISAAEAEGCSLELTETPGVFKVNGTKAAFAEAEGKQYASMEGYLTLPAGKYEVEFVDTIYYINSGDKITVYNPCSIDLSAEKHTNKEGKVFIGWTKNGEPAELNGTYAAGDILEAQYIDYAAYDESAGTGDFFIKGAQIRTEGVQGLRFIVEKKDAFYDQLPNAGEFGTIVLPTEYTWGRDIFIDQPVIREWQWDAETKMNFTPKTNNGYTPATVVGEKLFAETEDGVQYTLCITNITEEKYYRHYTVKGYIKYTDLNGIDQVFYSEYYQTNLYSVALEALEAGEQPASTFEAIKNYVEVTRKEEYLAENYDTRTLLCGYPTTADTDPNHAMYALQNGIKVREVTIDTGKGERDPVEIVHFADTHLNYINEKDLEIGDINTLSTYRGRGWLRDGSSVPNISRMMEYASFFDKAVITGDIMDYFSWGCAEIMQKMIIDVDPDILLAIGNHEPAELMQNDIAGLTNKYTLEERYERLATFWPHDLKYYSEIIQNDDGTDMAMLVVLDNQRDKYWAEQYEPFEADIERARELDIPILIFQHDPICTKNPNETDVMWFYEKGDYATGNNNFSAKFAGSNENDADTMAVYNLIVRNSDVIKGVFCGHWHNHMYTEIYAQNADGTFKKDDNGEQVIIPQYIVTANAYGSGNAIKITVK